MNKRGLLSVLMFLILFPVGISGQVSKKRIGGFVANSLTREHVRSSKVYLLLPDSTVIDSTVASNGSRNGKPQAVFLFQIDKEGDYLVRCEHEGYVPSCTKIHVKFYKREDYIDIGGFYMKRKPREQEQTLGEVTVKATKIKFYQKGDTMVYNADAFQLAEGSMLDALISQLPGVELKDDGRIFVNGKYVESLLLNGKDFFRNDRRIMLDNLPSYMVKDVKVYEKDGELSKLMGRNLNDKQFVMDVNLKREYSIGWIGNAEGGLGSYERYLGRFFALRFSPQSRVSVFGNLNNLNETRTPGKDGEWSPSDLGYGLESSKMAGLDYRVDDKYGLYELSGNAQMKHSDSDSRSETSSVNFLPGGDTYGRSRNQTNTRNTTFSTDHRISLKTTGFNLSFSPHLDYNRYSNFFSSLSATASSDPDFFGKSFLDSINGPDINPVLRRILLNRIKESGLSDGHRLNMNLASYFFASIPHTNDLILLDGKVSYSDAVNHRFSHYLLDYPSSLLEPSDYRNRYDDTPDRSYNYSVGATYWFWLPNNIAVIPFYRYSHSYHSNERSLYRLDKLPGWDESSDPSLGALPSTTDSLQQSLDVSNSYNSRRFDFVHSTGLKFQWERINNVGKWAVSGGLPFQIETNRLHYRRSSLDTVFSRPVFFLNPYIDIEHATPDWRRNIKFHYGSSSSAPVMIYNLNIRDDSNPLYITLGNPNLKNSHTHLFTFYYSESFSGQRMVGVDAGYQLTLNALAMGSVYDKKTGVRTSSPDNVNGNWSGWTTVNYSSPLDKQKRLNFSTNTSAYYYNNVDLAGVDGEISSVRSTVHSLYLSETLKADYRLKGIKLGVKLNAKWTNVTSARSDFSRINAFDLNYGLNGLFELPWKFQFGTDLTMYTRRGYSNSLMNTDELVWNARLSKSVLDGKLTLILDGFDILGNLSNVYRSLNAQGRSESYYNVIPRYVMLRCVYRLNIQPKKK